MKRIVAALAVVACLASSTRPAFSELDRSTPIPPGPARPFQTAPLGESALASGLRVAVAEARRLPIVAVQLVLPFAGSAYDPDGKSGLAAFVTGLMQEGAGGRDSLRFAQAFEALGAGLEVKATPDAMVATVFTVKENLDKALGLLADMVRDPALPASELPRLQQEVLTGLEIQKGDPGKAAEETLARATFGSHPYGRSPDERSISGLTLGDIKAFHAAHVRPEGAIIAASGDVTLPEFSALATKHFGDWKGAAAAPGAVPAIAETDGTPSDKGMIIQVIDMPGSQQSAIRAGHRSVARGAPDYAAVAVMNFVLGGGMLGRLNQNLREKHGWAYGAGSRLDALKQGGSFVISADVETPATAQALREILRELSRLQTEPVPAEELERAKRELAGSFVLRQQKIQSIAAQAASVELYGLPSDYVARFRQQILATTIEDVRNAARAHLRAGDLQVVISGDAAKIRGELGQIAPVKVVPAAGGPAS